MTTIPLLDLTLHLLPEKAVYVEPYGLLLVSDLHLGKSETFQSAGIPIASSVNHDTLDRLTHLCNRVQPQGLVVLGDVFHSKRGLVEDVLDAWCTFEQSVAIPITAIAGNHDRALLHDLHHRAIACVTEAIHLEQLILSHEPMPQPGCVNICGHVHPYIRLQTRLDRLRLPCFYLEHAQHLLILPAFGAFTGGYDVIQSPTATAFVIAEQQVIALTPER